MRKGNVVVAAVVDGDDPGVGCGGDDAAAAVFGVEVAGEPAAAVGEEHEGEGRIVLAACGAVDADGRAVWELEVVFVGCEYCALR